MKKWLTEYEAEGLNLERFVRACAEKDVHLAGLHRKGKRLSFLAYEEDEPVISLLCEQGGWHMTRGKRHGAGRMLEAIRRRWLLCAFCVAALCALGVVSQVMWRIDIRGAGSYLAEMRAYLDAEGIHAPQWKRNVSPGQVRERLEYRYPQIAWIECGWRGTTLAITVHEGVPEGETMNIAGSSNVIAERDGVVDAVITLSGTPQVKSGDVVKAGQILILGEERGKDETTHPVAARGSVTARVWDAATIQMSTLERQTTYTGRQAERIWIETPWFALSPAPEAPFEQYDLRRKTQPLGGFFFPLILHQDTYLEAEIRTTNRDMEALKAEAAIGAMRKLREKIGTSAKLIDKWVEYCIIEDGILQAVAIGERHVEIGVREPTAPSPAR